MIRFIHTADWHCQKGKLFEPTIRSIDAIIDAARSRCSDFIAIAGDFWDASMYNAEASGFTVYTDRLQRLADIAPLLLVEGTITHDVPGSVDILERLKADHEIIILRPGVAYFLTEGGIVESDPWENETTAEELGAKALIFGIPEPSKSWLLADDKEALSRNEATEVMNERLRGILLGLASTRKDYRDLPCVLLYHGHVQGADMGGQSVEDGLSIDDLQMVGADYIAGGDIHLPQRLGSNFYYPGSIVAQTRSEEHQPGLNLVTISDKDVSSELFDIDYEVVDPEVERIDLPQPRNLKIKATIDNWTERIDSVELTNLSVWLQIRCTKEAGAKLDLDALHAELVKRGAHESSVVTIDPIASETVRAEGITRVDRPRDKVQVWAENTGLTVGEDVLSLADLLEAECAAEIGTSGSQAWWRLNSVRVRGAKGVWKGLHADEVVLDFNAFGAGAIALVARNGSGKSTLLDNCHMYPCLMTKDATLQSQFRLRDSAREVVMTDTRTGVRYRGLMLIDGNNKSGGVEYHLYHDLGAGWVPYPGDTGRKEAYETAVNDLFGPMSMYLKYAYLPQTQNTPKGAPLNRESPDFNDATKAQKVAMYTELAGNQRYQVYTLRAHERARAITDTIAADEIRLTAIAESVQRIPVLEARIAEVQGAATDVSESLYELANEVELAKSRAEVARSAAESYRQTARTVFDHKTRRERLRVEKDAKTKERLTYEAARIKRADAQKEIDRHGELEAEKESIEREYSAWLEGNAHVMAEYDAERERCQAHADEISGKKAQLEREISRYSASIATANSAIEHNQRIVDGERHDACPECGAHLPWVASEDEKRAHAAAEVEKATKQVEADTEAIAVARKGVADLDAEADSIVWPQKPEATEFDRSRLEAIAGEMAWIDVAGAEATVRKADAAQAHIEQIDARLTDIGREIIEVDSTITELEAMLDPGAEEGARAAQAEHETLQRRHTEAQNNKAALDAEAKQLRVQVAELARQAEGIEELRVAVTAKKEMAERWLLLKRAFSAEGIQALELDALAPSLSEISNNLLRESYDGRFSVEIRTTKMSGSGAKTKQIESFGIWIFDGAEKDPACQWQEFSELSGGESTYVRKAIQDSFAIATARNGGRRFETPIYDERDGGLDPEAVTRYYRLITASMDAMHAHQILFVTHNDSVQQMCPQVIRMDELVVSAKVAEVAA